MIEIEAEPATLARLLARLAAEDAAAGPFLTEGSRRALCAATADLAFRTARPVVGEGERAVRKDFEICTAIPPAHPLHALRRATDQALRAALARFEPPVRRGGFALNDLVVQRYRPGSAGITPHRDHLRYRGLVALVLLEGDGAFAVCADRAGTAARDIATRPGDLILMRAPGLFDRADRPFHFLRGISIGRLSIGLRHDATPPPTEGAPS
jgi:hypothetical protein